MRVDPLPHNVLAKIGEVIGDTSSGLTGSQIGSLLAAAGIADVGGTKKYRVSDSLEQQQARDQAGNKVIRFLQLCFEPVRWIGDEERFEEMRESTNAVLAFAGLEVREDGNVATRARVTTLSKTRSTSPEVIASSDPESVSPPRPSRETSRPSSAALEALRGQYSRLAAMSDRQAAGREFERFLNSLFAAFGLDPHEPFRLIGEQIDGSFEMDAEVYLLEAKWTAERTELAEMDPFFGKLRRKSVLARGLFISMNGYFESSLTAAHQGDGPSVILMDGAHMMRVLDGSWHLVKLLRYLWRMRIERGQLYTPVTQVVAAGVDLS